MLLTAAIMTESAAVGIVIAHPLHLSVKRSAHLEAMCISETAPQLVRLALRRFAWASRGMEDI